MLIITESINWVIILKSHQKTTCNSKLFIWNSAYEIFRRRSIYKCLYIGAYGELWYTHRHTRSDSLLCTPIESCSTQTYGQPIHLVFPAPTRGCLSRQMVQEKLCRFMICFLLSPAPRSPPALGCVQGLCALCPTTEAVPWWRNIGNQTKGRSTTLFTVVGNHNSKYFIPLAFGVISEFW